MGPMVSDSPAVQVRLHRAMTAAGFDRASGPFTADNQPTDARTQRERVRLAQIELLELSAQLTTPHLRRQILRIYSLLRGEPVVQSPAKPPPFRLTLREMEVLTLVATGCSNVEAAEQLTIRAETVKTYMRSIMRKMGVRNRTAAVHTARQIGLLD
ncbi:helix-turn-helix transcriptional regulator [Candidatus Frankia alpina]|uniref:Response regulator transcription factor n=1 Tax=Candidatus Frankia alpina TaxID=2699483 RepID=A0A4S5BGL0_9ACTN|nr:LuxR C-terminal-related transcriptional regulator [Candidatus Frankia alpina]THJ29933.1 response regulator transcription factor [Candidatus Frankia alpina]